MLALVFVGASAAMLILWLTAAGLGVSHDSTVYIDAAESLVEGSGLLAGGKPLITYPPGYPLLLALTDAVGHGQVLEGARLLNAVLLGASVFLVGIAVQMCAQGSSFAAGCAILIFLSSPPVLTVYSMAWSEPPFVVFTLATVTLLSLHIVDPRLTVLLCASASFGLALVTRYAGIGLLPAMIIGLLGVGNRPVRDKIRDASIAAVVGCAPLGVWLIRNLETAHTATGRRFAVHLAGIDHVKALCSTLLAFISPETDSARVKALQLALLTAGVLVSAAALRGKGYARDRASPFCIAFSSISVLFASTYVVFLFVCVSFFTASTPLDARLLLPVFALLVGPVTLLAWSLSQAFGSRIIRWGVLSIVTLLVVFNGKRAVAEAIDVRANGRGYTSTTWRTSPSIRLVRSLAEDRKIFSNGPDVIRFLTGRRVVQIPPHTLLTREPNRGYEEQLRAMCDACRRGEALIVYFDGLAAWFLPTRQQLTSKCDLPVLRATDDGMAYGTEGNDAFPRAVP